MTVASDVGGCPTGRGGARADAMNALRSLAYRLWWTWNKMRLGSDVLRARGYEPPGRDRSPRDRRRGWSTGAGRRDQVAALRGCWGWWATRGTTGCLVDDLSNPNGMSPGIVAGCEW